MGFDISSFATCVDARHILTGDAVAPYLTDWTGAYQGRCHAVMLPGTPQEVAAIIKESARQGLSITPQSGNSSVAGGSVPARDDGIVLSLARLTRIRAVDPLARTASVDGGVILQNLQDHVADYGLDFPLMFGARGTARIGGCLATNAGGSNVLRYGNARDLCLGLEVVLPNGEILHGLTGLRKDNSGYDLKNLIIGSEGTLGIITGAVLKLVATPKIRITGFLSMTSIEAALELLNQMQDATGGLVEAFEYLPAQTLDLILRTHPGMKAPLAAPATTGILFEIASTRPSDAAPGPDGQARLHTDIQTLLADQMARGNIEDAMLAMSDSQRQALWTLREAVLPSLQAQGPFCTFDASLPTAELADFIQQMDPRSASLGFCPYTVGHLGDGNLHYAVGAAAGRIWQDLPLDQLQSEVLDQLRWRGGSFSAEHGIGVSKRDVMASQKQPEQLAAMRAIKQALDAPCLMNPGKLLPEP